MKNKKITLLAFVFLLSGLNSFSQNVQCISTPINPPSASFISGENAHTMIKDRKGNLIFVCGSSQNGNGDFQFSKISPGCGVQWTSSWDSPSHLLDAPWDLAVDEVGNIYATGISDAAGGSRNLVTIKFDANGNYVWDMMYNGYGHTDWGNAITVYGDLVYVTGFTFVSTYVVHGITLAYNSLNGNLLWSTEFDYNDQCMNYLICTDVDGNPYVTGEIKYGPTSNLSDIYTVKYDRQTGTELWTRYNHLPQDPISSLNRPNRIVSDYRQVIVGGTGWNANNNTDDFEIFSYDFSGNPMWSTSFDMASTHDGLRDILCDKNNGAVYATGATQVVNQGANESDVLTISLNAYSGNLNWRNQYNGKGNQWDYGMEITLDCNDHPYVGAKSQQDGSTNYEYLVLSHLASNGNINWVGTYNDAGSIAHLNDVVALQDGVYASGMSGVATIVSFSGVSKICNEARSSLSDNDDKKGQKVFPNPSTGSFNYYSENEGNVSIHDINNREIKNYIIKEGSNEINLTSLANGMYQLLFINTTGVPERSDKIIIQK